MIFSIVNDFNYNENNSKRFGILVMFGKIKEAMCFAK